MFSPRTAFAPRVAVAPRPDLPTRVPDDSGTAVVVGGGIAGVSAALVLAERGVSVELLEAAPALGGRLGTWRRTLPDGTGVTVEHGYHGFFRQYYTLRAILRRLDPELGFLRDVGGYPIEGRDPAWAAEDFTDLPRVPLANLAALVWKSPSFRLRDLRHVDGREALEMLRYDPVATFAKHDHRTTAELLDAFGFSERGRAMLFEVFAHSFFNTEQRYSAAEFLAMCHFYFTGNPEGLGMDAPRDQYATTLWEPFTRLLEKHGATVTTGARATVVVSGQSGWSVGVQDGPTRTARHLVVATDVPGTRALFERSPGFATTAPRLAERVAGLPGGEPYVVARFWCRGDVDAGHAPFTGVTRERVLDSVTLFHRLEAESAAWARDTGGSVIELHSYACPHDASLDDLVAADAHRAHRDVAGVRRPRGARRRRPPLHQRARLRPRLPPAPPRRAHRRPRAAPGGGLGGHRHPLGAHGAGRADRGAGRERRPARGGGRAGARALDRAAGHPRGTHPAVIIRRR